MARSIAVLFDLDGVIVDSRPHHLDAWHELAREANLTYEPDYFTRTFGLRNDAILGPLLPGVTPEQLQELAERKEAMFREKAREKLELLPGVRDLLGTLRKNEIRIAVVTSTPRPNLDMILEALTVREYFEALVSEEDVTRGKPDPEGFLLAAQRLGVAPPECVVIEDAPAGLQAANAAGMGAIGVTTTRTAPDLADADLVVESLGEESVRAFVFQRA